MGELEEKILKVENESYLIDKGVRSCALTTVSGYYQKETDVLTKLEEIVMNHKLHYYIYKKKFPDNDLGVYVFWIYKYHHQLALIKYIESKKGDKDIITEWITGKLLGYSDESIEDYLNQLLIDKITY